MREGRPYTKLALHVAQLVILISLISAVNTQTWYSGVVDIEYTEGLPKGAGLELELEVNQTRADGSIHIDGFLTFIQWQNTRNDTTIPTETTEQYDGNAEFAPLSEIQESVPLYANIALCLGILLLGLTFFEIKNRAILGLILNGLVLWIIISLAILAPIGYIGGMEFGTGSQEPDRESTVHQSVEGEPKFDLISGELDYKFVIEGYDLGLVNDSNLDEVIAKPPGDDHRSFIAMDGVAGIHYGSFVVELIWAWLVLFVATPMIIGFVNFVRIDRPQRIGIVEEMNSNVIVIINEPSQPLY
jgi:hypothetical protein